MRGACPEAVHVVVPARDEAASLPRHLRSLAAAAARLGSRRPGIPVRATVVLDSCTDHSAAVLDEHPWVEVTSLRSGVVGEVRARGVERARSRAAGVAPDRLWIASTDADTVVPSTWLTEQLALAAQGHDLVVGTVHPDPDDLPPGVLAAWRARHRLREGHDHVHGANLGFTLAAYDRVGGFEPLATGEDVRLVTRMREVGVPWCATARTQVVTSGRRVARAPGGFAAYLGALVQ